MTGKAEMDTGVVGFAPAPKRTGPSSTRVSAAIGAALILSLMWGCGVRDTRPNLLIVLVDTLRPDHLGCYGYGRDTSPGVDSLASRGALFESCIATSDYTQASTASLFTGLYPLAHGYVNSDYTLDSANQTLAEVLAESGYATGAFIANGLAGRKYGMEQGFETHFEKNRALAPELVDQAIDFVHTRRSQPFFAYMHFMDVHDPHRTPAPLGNRYAPPGGFAQDMQDTLLLEHHHAAAWWGAAQGWWDSDQERQATEEYFSAYGRTYDAAIRYWDGELGRLVQALSEAGAADNTILVITADHGEQLMEHGFFGHANSGYEVGLRVPLIICDPRATATAGVRVATGVSLLDLMPTVLARLGVPAPEGLQGVDRWALTAGGGATDPAAGDGFVYTEGTFFANRPFHTLIQTGRLGGWKLILDRLRDTKELYHLDTDPGEERDQFSEQPEQVQKLWELTRAQYETNRSRMGQLRDGARERDAEKLRELTALGYVGGGGRLQQARAEYGPMRSVAPSRYGPFGDEPGPEPLADRIDFPRGQVQATQIVRGLSDPLGRRDSRGVWFDRRATFLLRRGDDHGRAAVSAYVDTLPGSGHPSRLELLIDDQITASVQMAGPGLVELSAALPNAIEGGEYLHLEVRADHRFVYRPGPSPRTHGYAAFRVLSVRLEE